MKTAFALLLLPLLFTSCGQDPSHSELMEAYTDSSSNWYRLPYANGTKVYVSRDHTNHTPVGRYDMSGRDGSNYKVVAAAPGTIRYIQDKYSAKLDTDTAPTCFNNYVWIEHKNGEWSKYSHMTKGSTTGDAKLKVGDSVNQGTFLGYQGEVGCASGPHVHFEIGVPRVTDPINVDSGSLKDNEGSKRNRRARMCSLPGNAMANGQTYTAGDLRVVNAGQREVSQLNMDSDTFACVDDQAKKSGYVPAWIEGSSHGKILLSAVYRPSATPTVSFANLSKAQFAAKLSEWQGKGYRLKQIESYTHSNALYFAAIFAKDAVAVNHYYGISNDDHQKRIDDLSKQGWMATNVSVVSQNGARVYSALYEKKSVGSYEVKSQIRIGDYQEVFDANVAAGRQLVYRTAYSHDGQIYFSAIFNALPAGGWYAKFGLEEAAFKAEATSRFNQGYQFINISSYVQDGKLKFAGIWRK